MHLIAIPMAHLKIVFHYLLQIFCTDPLKQHTTCSGCISKGFVIKLCLGCKVMIEGPTRIFSSGC